MMRITPNDFSNNFLNQITTLTARQSLLQSQAASGQKLQNPEDDPGAMQRVLSLQAEAGANTQYQNNIARLQELATASYSGMNALKKISDRASELATLADGLKSPEELRIYGNELNQLIQHGVQIANTQNRGDYIFSGNLTNITPFAATTDSSGLVTAVNYQGNNSVAAVEIAPGVTVSAQTPGANTSGVGTRGLITDSRSGADFFNHLISLRDHLLAGNATAVATTDRPALAKDEDNFLYQFGSNGAFQARLESTASLTKNRSGEVEKLISKDADADLAETLTRLSQTQNAYQAALQSGASILKMSLMDYLR